MNILILGMIFLVMFPLNIGKFPAELNLELEKENSFLKVYLICYNPTSEALSFKVNLKIVKKGLSGVSNILQNKKIVLSPKEKIKPMLGILKIDPEDFYTIEVKIWDKDGNLILEKTVSSGNWV